jgi:hypothetical protein
MLHHLCVILRNPALAGFLARRETRWLISNILELLRDSPDENYSTSILMSPPLYFRNLSQVEKIH